MRKLRCAHRFISENWIGEGKKENSNGMSKQASGTVECREGSQKETKARAETTSQCFAEQKKKVVDSAAQRDQCMLAGRQDRKRRGIHKHSLGRSQRLHFREPTELLCQYICEHKFTGVRPRQKVEIRGRLPVPY